MDINEMLCIVDLIVDFKLYFWGIYVFNFLFFCVIWYFFVFVSNIDFVEKKGFYWVVFWFKNGIECEFYDSFGRILEDYDIRLREFLDRNSFVCMYNNV